jgi:hypothetical protein
VNWIAGAGKISWRCGNGFRKRSPGGTNSAVIDQLQITLHDAVSLLEARDVTYALIGGLATSLRGQARATADVDLVVAIDTAAALAIAGDLEHTPFAPLFDDISQVIERSYIMPLRHRSTGVKVDVSIGLSGFEQLVISRAEAIELYGRPIAVATTEDLVIMKALAGRPQDDQDLRGMLTAQSHRMDWEYCLQMATDLGEAVGQDLAGRIRRMLSEIDAIE